MASASVSVAQEGDAEALLERLEAQEEMLGQLQAALAAQQAVVAELRGEVERLQGQLGEPAASPGQVAQKAVPEVEKPRGGVRSLFDVRVYGYVKLDAIYDSHRTAIGNFALYNLPEGAEQNDGEFAMTANQSRLGLDVKGPVVRGGETSAKIEVDFYGSDSPENKAKLRMRRAFAQWQFEDFSMLAGQEWDTLLTVIPVSVDFSYFMHRGKVGYRRPQVRLTYEKEAAGTTFVAKVAGARTLGSDFDGLGQDDGSDSGHPTVEFNLQAKRALFGKKVATVSFSGHWGEEHVDSAAGVLAGDYESYSLIGSFEVPFGDHVLLRGSLWRGANLDAYYGGIGQGINAARGTVVDAQGGFVQLSWLPTGQWQAHATYGIDDPEDADLPAGGRTKNEHLTFSAFYYPHPSLGFAAEFTYLETSYLGLPTADNNRYQGAVIFKF